MNQKNKGGWYEDADPACINEQGKPVARKHHEVAMKDRYSSTLRIPLMLKHEDKEEDEDLTEEIIEEVQSKRKPQAIDRDNAKTAEKVGSKDNVEDLVDWIKNPGESNLEGVDDKQPKIKPVESGAFKGCLKVDESEPDTKSKR